MRESKAARNGKAAEAPPPGVLALPSEGQEGPPWDHGENDPAGRPWWRHDLFPLELTPPEVVGRWWLTDRRNLERGGSGHPDVVTVARYSEEIGNWVDIPGRLDLAKIDRDVLMRRLGPGRFKLTAFSFVPAGENGTRKLAAVRGGSLLVDDLELDDDDEQEEPAAPAAVSPHGAGFTGEAQLRAMRLELEADDKRRTERQAREDRDWEDRRSRLTALDREEREARDRRASEDRDRDRAFQLELAKLRATPAATPTQDPISGAITMGLAAFMAKKIPSLLEGVMGGGAGAAKSTMAKIGESALDLGDALAMEVLAPLAKGWAQSKGWIPEEDRAVKSRPVENPPPTGAPATTEIDEGGDDDVGEG